MKLPDGWMMPVREFFLDGFDKNNPHLFQFEAKEQETTPMSTWDGSKFVAHPSEPIVMAKCRLCGVVVHPSQEFMRGHAYLHLAVQLAVQIVNDAKLHVGS